MSQSPHVAGTTTGVLPTRLVPPDFSKAPPEEVGGTGMATASLVLGIVSLLLDVLAVPTLLAITFGIVALAKGTRGKKRAIVGIVLGIVSLPVQAAIAIPVYLATQSAAGDARVKSALANDAMSVAGYAAENGGQLPEVVGPAALAKYGWDDTATVTSLVYSIRGRGQDASFCLLATARNGHRFVVTTHTPVTPAAACPTEW